MPFTRKTTPSQPPTCFFLSIDLPTTPRRMARSFHRCQGCSQENVDQRRRRKGGTSFQFDNRTYAYRTAHFGAKTSAWHCGRVSGALLCLIHQLLDFRHAGWVYIDDFLFLFPRSTANLKFTLAVILLPIIGARNCNSTPLLNGTMQPALMMARLPAFKLHKITALTDTLLQNPCRKNLEKVIGIILWATSLVHHTRFLLTSLYKDLNAIPATNYSIQRTQWAYLLSVLKEDTTVSTHNNLHLPMGARIVEFKHIIILTLLLRANYLLISPSHGTPGSVSETPTQTNENSPRTLNKPYSGS